MKKIILFSTFLFTFASALPAAEETIQSKQIANCERIGYPQWRDDCFESLSASVLNYGVCVKFTNKSRRDACISNHPPKSADDCLLNKADKKQQTACLGSFGQAPVAKPPQKTTRENQKQKKAAKLQQVIEEKQAKALEKAVKLQAAKDAHETKAQAEAVKRQEAKDAREAKVQTKKTQLQQKKDAQAQLKAKKIQKAKDAREAKAQEKAAKLQAKKDAKTQMKEELPEQTAEVITVAEPAEPAVVEMPMEETPTPVVEETAAPEPIIEEKTAEVLPMKTKAQEKAEKIQKARKAKEAAAKEKAGKLQKIKDDKEAAVKENLGCTNGFGSWAEPPLKKKEEIACDKENVEKFAALLSSCMAADHNINILSYDINKDLCVTCDDLKLWQKQVNKLFDAKKRSTNGKNLKLKECAAQRKF